MSQIYAERRVSELWKYVAVAALGVVMGNAPTFGALLLAQKNSVTIVDVDREITVQNAAIVQKIDDLKEQVADLKRFFQDHQK